MLRLTKWIGVSALAVGLLALADAPRAQAADGFGLRIGRLGITGGAYRNYGYGYGVPGYRSYYRGYAPRYRSHYGYRHHGVPHYDYHGPSLVPHGNHLDYVPGHYDFHHGHHGHH